MIEHRILGIEHSGLIPARVVGLCLTYKAILGDHTAHRIMNPHETVCKIKKKPYSDKKQQQTVDDLGIKH